MTVKVGKKKYSLPIVVIGRLKGSALEVLSIVSEPIKEKKKLKHRTVKLSEVASCPQLILSADHYIPKHKRKECKLVSVNIGHEDLVEVNYDDYRKLKRLYNKAVKEDKIEFKWKGRDVLTAYAKYLIEYLETRFGKRS